MPRTSRKKPDSPNAGKKKNQSIVRYCVIPSPVGHLLLAGDQKALHCLSFQDGKNPEIPSSHWIHDQKPFNDVIQQLGEYFSGTRTTFSINLSPHGTPFQRRVWHALTKIPYGQTVSYGSIAKSIGQPTASRAVGSANGQNPLSIFVPCHRVIGQSGQLIGYGGGLHIKEKLLALEHQVSSKCAPMTS
ncbi:MAG: methylated-DNA--[protein]-cysteine S-methyltransferase [Nitrospirota bacterium]|nr:methylated-DNA--[protein]-cysteine S-methyltransferase [Nitrospirota bacterium]